ncbi:MAG: beta-lactamase family protein [Myxococcales bacterium]|nr:beta-lactamase family protein [Myxococcales bacterium]MCB9734414.1 beta-lactamase family protein [Deltaproteobacteria bacterium]
MSIPPDLDAVTRRGPESDPAATGLAQDDVEAIWRGVLGLYETGTQPAISVCLRHRGQVFLNRAVGHSHGPATATDTAERVATPDTQFCVFSASKAITAIIMHELDARNLLRLEDPVVEYLPEFGRHRKRWVTLRHVLTHRAGIPAIPTDLDPLELAHDWEGIIERLCDARPTFAAGRQLAYHAVTGGYILAEAAHRATGKPITEWLRELIAEPLGIPMSYGVAPEHVDDVAKNRFTGYPVPFPISKVIERSLGLNMTRAVAASNDPRFLTGVIPSGNIVTTADGLSSFFQLLLDGGKRGEDGLLDRRAVRRARVESAYFKLDLTLGIPVRYGHGLMLGARRFSMFGPDTRRAFGHYGFVVIIGWADPERDIAGAILTSGKSVVANQLLPIWRLLSTVSQRVPKR